MRRGSRLTTGDSGHNPATGTGVYEFWFDYNSIGSLTKLRDTEGGSVLADWDYGDTTVGAGAYAVDDWNLDPGAAVAIGYDESGNMITRGGDTLIWDADNRLHSYDQATGTDTGFVYDADGNPLSRPWKEFSTRGCLCPRQNVCSIHGVGETDRRPVGSGHRRRRVGDIPTAFGGDGRDHREASAGHSSRRWLSIHPRLGSCSRRCLASDRPPAHLDSVPPGRGTRGATGVGRWGHLLRSCRAGGSSPGRVPGGSRTVRHRAVGSRGRPTPQIEPEAGAGDHEQWVCPVPDQSRPDRDSFLGSAPRSRRPSGGEGHRPASR